MMDYTRGRVPGPGQWGPFVPGLWEECVCAGAPANSPAWPPGDAQPAVGLLAVPAAAVSERTPHSCVQGSGGVDPQGPR